MNVAESKVSRAQRRYEARQVEKDARKAETKQRQSEIEARRAEKSKKASETWNWKKPDRNIRNQKCQFETADEEMENRHETAAETLKVYKRYLPGILKDLSEIKDPRNPKKIDHTLSLLMLYGIFMFVFHNSSRRDADKDMNMVFMENMRAFFPELDSLPHSVTLARLLERIDVLQIEKLAVNLINRLIRNKKFQNYTVGSKYIIGIDGTQKFTREYEWCKNSSKRHKKGQPEGVNQYYAYALEACLILPGGISLPFMTEFLDRHEYNDGGVDTENQKQDSERKAFYRLANRLKKYFPQLKIAVTLDGLYPNGPVVELCRKYQWDYMIVLKDGSLKSVWEYINPLKDKGELNEHHQNINGIEQKFYWINGIDYRFGDNGTKAQNLNVVICEETFMEMDGKTGYKVPKTKKFAWISEKEINERNVHKRCNLIGRPRWNIETQNLVEKHHGYAYEHCFSYDWEVMKGFHYLMHLAHIINVLTVVSEGLSECVKKSGVRGFIRKLWLVFSGSILDIEKLHKLIPERYQIRLAI